MPASVNDAVTTSLMLSLSTKPGAESVEVSLQQRLASASKRVLMTEIEYESSNDTYQSSVLQNLKAKYTSEQVEPNKSHLTNGNGQVHKINGNGISNGLNGNSGMFNGCRNSTQHGDPILPVPTVTLYPMEQIRLQWPRNCPTGAGLVNAGNSCYLNSVLQALFHIPPFVNWLLTGDLEHQQRCNVTNGSFTECIVCCMAQTLRSCHSRNNAQFRPYLILTRLRSICRRMTPGQQEDAMEFLRYLIEAMEKAYLQRFQNLRLDSCSKETTPLHQIFGGYIRTDVTCLQCRGVSTTFQHFLDLTLDISRGPTLEHALDTYFSQERLEGDNSYRCEKCRRKVPAAKQFFVEKPPNVLCLQLKRFNFEGRKIGKSLQFTDRVQLHRYLSRKKNGHSAPSLCTSYRLAACVNHLGNASNSGHYTTMAYAPNNQMYIFDDSTVQRLWRQTQLPSQDVYLLMYILDNKAENKSGVTSIPSATVTSQNVSPQPGSSTSNGGFKASHTTFLPTPLRPLPSTATAKPSPSKPLVIINKVNKPLFNGNGIVSPKKEITLKPDVPSLSLSSSTIAAAKQKISIKISNGHSSQHDDTKNAKTPCLVPYGENQSSCDEDDGSNKSADAIQKKNGWIVTSAMNTLKRKILIEEREDKVDPKTSPVKDIKIDKVKPSPESHKKQLKLQLTPTTPKLEGECSVQSTPTSSWHVSTPTSNGVVKQSTTAPASEPSAQGWTVTPTLQSNRIYRKRKHGGSSSLSESEEEKETYEWVERTKETLLSSKPTSDIKKLRLTEPQYTPGNTVGSKPEVQPSKCTPTPTNKVSNGNRASTDVTSHLLSLNHGGYSGGHVSTWNGGRSLVERQVLEDRRERKRYEEDEYELELDAGRRKKIKGYSVGTFPEPENDRVNRFQREADQRSGYSSYRPYTSSHHRGQYRDSYRDQGQNSYRGNHFSNHNRGYSREHSNSYYRHDHRHSDSHHRDNRYRNDHHHQRKDRHSYRGKKHF